MKTQRSLPHKRRTTLSVRPALELLEDRATPALLTAPTTFPAGLNPGKIVVADFNTDGVPDIAVADTSEAKVNVLLGDGNGGFLAAQPTAVAGVATGLTAADFNGDTIPDLAVVFGTSQVQTFLGQGNGFFTSAVGGTTAIGGAIHIASGDTTGDGKADVIVAFNSAVMVGVGDGAGGLSFSNFQFVFGTINDLVAADFNQDGHVDVVTAASGGNDDGVILLLGTPGNFLNYGSFPPTAPPNSLPPPGMRPASR